MAPLIHNGDADAPNAAEQPSDDPEGEGQKSFYVGEGQDDSSETGSSCNGVQDDGNSSIQNGKVTPEAGLSGLTGSYMYRTGTPSPNQNSAPPLESWQVSPSKL